MLEYAGNVLRGLRAGIAEFKSYKPARFDWLKSVEDSFPFGCSFRRSLDGSSYVVLDGKCIGTYGFNSQPWYRPRNEVAERSFRVAYSKLLTVAGSRDWFRLARVSFSRSGCRVKRGQIKKVLAVFQGDKFRGLTWYAGKPRYAFYGHDYPADDSKARRAAGAAERLWKAIWDGKNAQERTA